MAIAFAQVTPHTRSKGHSAVAASAYRTATKLRDERTGIEYDFTNRKDVVFTEILLPEEANDQFLNREFLWNEAERQEKRKDSQVCKDFVLALPKELSLEHHIELARRFAQIHFTNEGIPVDIAIHHDDGNPHAHILVATRRLGRDGFSRFKARDLNPGFARGRVVEGDAWGEKWRDFQNSYFHEKGIDLSVDLNHIIPEKHEGKVRDTKSHYVHAENAVIREVREDLLIHHVENFINYLSLEHSVFTRKDIKTLLDKTIRHEENFNPFSAIEKTEEVLTNKNVIYLGYDEAGEEVYTTRHQYHAEARLLACAEKLQDSRAHIYRDRTEECSIKYNLNEEQRAAFSYLTEGSDIRILVGRPGTGKSYLMKPLREYYEANGCRILGAALSSRVAKALTQESGIESSTIASLSYRLSRGKLTLTKKDVLLIDEAGMVDFGNMSTLMEAVSRAGAKIILVGDANQLKPIKKGEIFRSLAERCGYIALDNITRQHDEGDRKASLAMADGRMDDALTHYANKGAVNIVDVGVSQNATTELVRNWTGSIESMEDVPQHLMLSFSRDAVQSLNTMAREALGRKNLLTGDEVVFRRDVEAPVSGAPASGDYVLVSHSDKALGLQGGESARIEAVETGKHIRLRLESGETIDLPWYLKDALKRSSAEEMPISLHERIIFRKNDPKIGVRNGDIGSVVHLSKDAIRVNLDSGEAVEVPKSYQKLDYAYATTVHKSQGLTVDKVSVLIDSKYWDRALAFVAFTRHRKSLDMYVNDSLAKDRDALGKILSRKTTRDNVIDWPLNLATRHGINPDGLIARAARHLSGVGNVIRNAWHYVVHYETSLGEVRKLTGSREQARQTARLIADFQDASEAYKASRKSLGMEAECTNSPLTSLKGFSALYAVAGERDEKAHLLWSEHRERLSSVSGLDVGEVERASARFTRVRLIRDFAHLSRKDPLPEAVMLRSREIDLAKDRIHIQEIAKEHQITPEALTTRIQGAQKSQATLAFDALKQKHPILAEYDKLVRDRALLTGFRAEKLDKEIARKAREILGNKQITQALSAHIPDFVKSLQEKAKGRGFERDR